MVKSLIKLKLRLAGNTYTRSGWALAGTIIAGLYGLGIVGMLITSQVVSGGLAESYHYLLVSSALISAAVTLGWLLVPLLMTGGDSAMDPRQLITFGIPRRSLVIGLAAARMISIGAVLTALWLLGQVLLWRSSLLAALIALVTAPLLLVTFTLISQATTTAASAWFGGRRSRDLMAILGIGIAMLSFPIVTGVTRAFETLQDALPTIVDVLAWTPLAAGVALPYDAAEGQWGHFALRLLIVLATAGTALLLIRTALISITERPRSQSGGGRTARPGNTGLFKVFPDRPWGAVASRAATYWMKDARYGGSLIVVPAVVVLALFLSWQGNSTWALYALGPFIAWMMGYSISADVSYDNTAFALHVTTGVSGLADRTGRAAALLSFSLPLVLTASVVPMLFVGSLEHLLVVTALSVGTLLGTAGLSAVISARLVYPTPKPGDSPFKQPEGVAGRIMVIQMVTMILTVLVMIPELVLLITWLVTGSTLLLVILLVVALVKGAALLVAGIFLGAKIYERTAPELFQQVAAH